MQGSRCENSFYREVEKERMKFTDSHEWIVLESADIATVGVSQYAQKELGEVVFIELPLLNRKVKQGEEVAVLESTKAAADIYAPVSGTIIAVNESLRNNPETINASPELHGWIFKIHLSDLKELNQLKDAQSYQKMIQTKSG